MIFDALGRLALGEIPASGKNEFSIIKYIEIILRVLV